MTGGKQPPSEQDRYDIREQIGRGAFGSAFVVIHRDSKKQYVLKKIRLARQTDWQRKSSFQEMQVTMSLEHPYVVPYIESWVDRGHTINIVYGYCERGDLSSLLGRYRQRKQPIPEANLKLWLCQCLMALEHCHSRSVLHRDIKSGNIFLTAEGNVMVGDFGLATVREGGSDEDHSLVGTPHYMSPELLAKRPYSFKSDIFSLGVVLYELSAQKPPFTAFNIHGLIHKIKRAPMPALPPNYTPEWANLIRNMLRKSPDQRPSATQLLNTPCLRDAYLEARRRALLLHPGMTLPELREPEDLPQLPERSQSGKLAVYYRRRGAPDPFTQDEVDGDGEEDCEGAEEDGGEGEKGRDRDLNGDAAAEAGGKLRRAKSEGASAARKRVASEEGPREGGGAAVGSLPSAAAIRQRSRARRAGGQALGTPRLGGVPGAGPVGDFDGSVAQRIPRENLAGEDEEGEGLRTDWEGAGYDSRDEHRDDDHARAEGCLGRRKGEADAPASAPRRTQAARRDRAGKARGTRANVGPRATASAIKASATPILTSWSPRTADAARRIRETGPGREDAAWPPTTATPDDAIATGRTPAPVPRHPGQPRASGDAAPATPALPRASSDAGAAAFETPAGHRIASFPISPTPLATGYRYATSETPGPGRGPSAEAPSSAGAESSAGREAGPHAAGDGARGSASPSPADGKTAPGGARTESTDDAGPAGEDGDTADSRGAGGARAGGAGDDLQTAPQSRVDVGSQGPGDARAGTSGRGVETSGGALAKGGGVVGHGASASEDEEDEDYSPDEETSASHDSDYDDLEEEGYGYDDEDSLLAELDSTRADLEHAQQVLALCTRLLDAGRLEELGYVLHASTGMADPEGVDAAVPGSRLQHLHQARKNCLFQLGDQVIVGNRRRLRAVIRYFGPTAFGEGDFVGMELERPDGKNDGTVSGVPYFSCAPGCGLFVRSAILRPEENTGGPAAEGGPATIGASP